MGRGRDRRRAAHQLELGLGFDQAALVKQLIGADQRRRRGDTGAGLGAHRTQPAHDLEIEAVVDAERIVDLAAIGEDLGQLLVDLGDREGLIGAGRRDRALDPEAIAIPDLALGVARTAEEHEGAILALGREHRHRLRLRESGQPAQVARLTIGMMHIAVADHLGRGRYDQYRVRAQRTH